jgi:hypothetical protein
MSQLIDQTEENLLIPNSPETKIILLNLLAALMEEL